MGMEELVDKGELAIFYTMGFASILAVAVFFERLIVYFRNLRRSDNLLHELIINIRSMDKVALEQLCEKYPKSVYARFTKFSLAYYNNGTESLSEMMNGQMIKEKIEFEKRLPILATLGNNAPFIGLLGTVLGVIKAFASLGTLGSSGAEVVMKSISTALFATAAGLLLAIPVVMVNNYFTKKTKVVGQNLEILSREILASITKKK